MRAAPVVLVLLGGTAVALHAAAERRLLDRIVALVDEDPILLSEVEQVVSLGLVAREPGEDEPALRRRVLDGLIEQRVRFHEIDRFAFADVPGDEIERQFAAQRAQFASDEEFRARLAAVGLDEEGLRQLLARQVIVLTYVEERLGTRVFVGLEDIRAYYETQLVPRLRAAGTPPPPLDEVRQEIRQVLREERLNAELERWTEELRREADVVDLWDAAHDELPPVVATSEE
jgi:peptidyl-prolyl cis-trans isomerase SurA